jgi:hypothetical protein
MSASLSQRHIGLRLSQAGDVTQGPWIFGQSRQFPSGTAHAIFLSPLHHLGLNVSKINDIGGDFVPRIQLEFFALDHPLM